MSKGDARRLLDREVERWMLFRYDDWIDLSETDPEDDDADLFFYLAEFQNRTFGTEVFFGPSEEGVVSIELYITLVEDDWEIWAGWEVDIDGRTNMLGREIDPEEES